MFYSNIRNIIFFYILFLIIFLLHKKIYKKKRKIFFIKFYKLKMNKIQQHELDF